VREPADQPVVVGRHREALVVGDPEGVDGLLEQRQQQVLLVLEAAVERALAGAGDGAHVTDGQVAEAGMSASRQRGADAVR